MSHRPLDPLALLREWRGLEALRRGEGLTPLEYLRWLDLGDRMARRFGRPHGEAPDKEHPTRLRLDYRDPAHVVRHAIRNLSRGGLFVATSFTAEVGTEFEVHLRIESQERVLVLPAVVVTNGVADGFSTASLGMGLHWGSLSPAQKNEWQALLEAGGATL